MCRWRLPASLDGSSNPCPGTIVSLGGYSRAHTLTYTGVTRSYYYRVLYKSLAPLELVFHLLLGVKPFVNGDLHPIGFADFNLQSLDELGLPSSQARRHGALGNIHKGET